MRARLHLARASALAAASLAACSGTQADEGLDAAMRVEGAQFVRGAMPSSEDGPPVAAVNLATNSIRAGQIGKPVKGSLDPRAGAAALTLRGDPGYWIVPAGVPEVDAPTFPSFHATLSFASSLASGDHELVVRAVDALGHFGPPTTAPLTAIGALVPDGTLVVTLTWDTESDLDLHVVDPTGAEIFNRNINSWTPPPPGQPVDPNAWKTGGILDFDSNAACVIDGRRQENVVWTVPPPSGHYFVRVDTFSLCGTPSAHWSVTVRRAGAVVAEARGSSFEPDTRTSHDRGAGVLAIEFDVP